MVEREREWARLMRAANGGDAAAYGRLLTSLTPVLRAAARRGLSRAGKSPDDAEDIVQDVLLAVHLKRHTWREDAPFGPWVFAITRNKIIDALRRRGRGVHVPVDDFIDVLRAEPEPETVPAREVDAHLGELPARQRDVLRAIAVESASIKDTAARLAISEGAVRVALHRGLAALSGRLREDEG